ncbi:MAG: hypothetical protein A3C84_04520 [Candidatus Ryanbacteria bacterium RIFCSPHIGHO2_02_FULL_48_12]|uniref:Peptidase M20 dimerisation domain-containing protein n=1 Tax=Candidatus Ryanbacteria bacterium RIFCSPHIGHO2_01_FULL_48_27 TaxID=1802115 RepID=A0A1G2G692_9BACT|nr:MAG: hypothetical protein A2756_02280 [Candidatus Ryanbacteria bacterium RIFCSPHIGHO2_01_FULL_48_27]OGZ49843.1 MAG: hypothetical protein A3C84_04520 [Candidatus Ryanbacteria bacterium RIFCSPHIGHO2_02_FULL_48_12]
MEDIEKILKQLVEFQSVTQDQEENGRLLDFVENTLKSHMHVRRFVYKGYHALFATVVNTKKPKIVLAAHCDVVPAPQRLFRMKANGSKLIGRGVLDMKFAIACYMRLVTELKKNLKEYDLGIMITSDEEVGGSHGVQYLLDKGYGAGRIAFLPDGGWEWRIETGAKGVWHIDVEAVGKSAHASRPWEGETPFFEFFEFLKDLKGQFSSAVCDGKDHYHDTVTVGRIMGGEAVNQIPSFIRASVDIRHIPETTKKDLERRILSVMKKYKKISMTERVYGYASKTNLDIPEIQTFRQIARRHGIQTGSMFSHGSSDARFFAEKNIPTLIVWPRGGGHHSDDEWVQRRDIETYYKILRDWVLATAK